MPPRVATWACWLILSVSVRLAEKQSLWVATNHLPATCSHAPSHMGKCMHFDFHFKGTLISAINVFSIIGQGPWHRRLGNVHRIIRYHPERSGCQKGQSACHFHKQGLLVAAAAGQWFSQESAWKDQHFCGPPEEVWFIQCPSGEVHQEKCVESLVICVFASFSVCAISCKFVV